MEKQSKKVYEAPDLTVVSFKAEKGYATSGDPLAAFGGWNGNTSSPAETPAMDDYQVENGGNYFSW